MFQEEADVNIENQNIASNDVIKKTEEVIEFNKNNTSPLDCSSQCSIIAEESTDQTVSLSAQKVISIFESLSTNNLLQAKPFQKDDSSPTAHAFDLPNLDEFATKKQTSGVTKKDIKDKIVEILGSNLADIETPIDIENDKLLQQHEMYMEELKEKLKSNELDTPDESKQHPSLESISNNITLEEKRNDNELDVNKRVSESISSMNETSKQEEPSKLLIENVMSFRPTRTNASAKLKINIEENKKIYTPNQVNRPRSARKSIVNHVVKDLTSEAVYLPSISPKVNSNTSSLQNTEFFKLGNEFETANKEKEIIEHAKMRRYADMKNSRVFYTENYIEPERRGLVGNIIRFLTCGIF